MNRFTTGTGDVTIAEFSSESVTIRDGREVVLRPIDPGDAPRLIDLHSRLSSDTQYLRFFGPKPDLTPDEAEYLAGVDFDRRYAIVADDAGGSIVAVARYDVTEESNAECAIVVRDDYQGQGLGTAVLAKLIQVARERGLTSFSGEILPENTQMLGLLKRYGLDDKLVTDEIVEVRASITQTPVVFSVSDADGGNVTPILRDR